MKPASFCLLIAFAAIAIGACGTSTPGDKCEGLVGRCTVEDELRCSSDSSAIEICDLNTDGCLVWTVSTDCSVSSQTCDDSGGSPACTGNCSNECTPIDLTQCDGQVVQRCQIVTGGCLGWVDSVDCVASSKYCDDSVQPAVCTDECQSDCLVDGEMQCDGDVVQICQNMGADCLQWYDIADCAVDGMTCDETLTPVQCVLECTANGDCDETEFCEFSACTDTAGTCVQKPLDCPDVWDPVCGCDEETYATACDAAAAGVSIDHPGECPPPPCTDNADCSPAGYCQFSACTDTEGICLLIPENCPEIWEPVCGCDEVTYANACEAAAASQSVHYPGECLPDPCEDNTDCEEGETYCMFVTCDAPVGTCTFQPGLCPTNWDPVCGCDGETYDNPCFAAMAGMSVDYPGECTQFCFPGVGCDEGYYCRYEDCETNTGVCVPRPELCPDVWDPVCGCDGETYENACIAAMAGMTVAYAGECGNARCWDNDMCLAEEYCLFPSCAAESGTCTERPETCPDVWDPVCGCNGQTYSNGCEAALAGMTVAHDGECESDPCWNNQMCDPRHYCWFESCAAETGTCMAQPDACIPEWDPVCGCDGMTYDNACFAAMAGMSVDHPGECDVVSCFNNEMCHEANYCLFESCAAETGTCAERPRLCPTYWEPVCGCDGVTYMNACFAAMAGQTIDFAGECESRLCSSNQECGGEDYCFFEECDQENGVCTARPMMCPDVYDPVCGCDQETYNNACFAAMAGASIDYQGSCE